MDRGPPTGHSPWGHEELDMPEQLSVIWSFNLLEEELVSILNVHFWS